MLRKPLIDGEAQEQSTRPCADEPTTSTKHIIIGIFHEKNGPTIACTTLPGDASAYEQSLFPSKWEENSVFMTKKSGHFILGICCFAPLIRHERGCYQLSVGLLSEHYSFSPRDFEFLRAAADCAQRITAVDIGSFTRVAAELSIPIGAPQPVAFDPLSYPFLSSGVISRLISRPSDLFAIWQARMLDLQIVVGIASDLYAATALGFFVGAITSPQDCGFTTEWYDVADMAQNGARVVSITLPCHHPPPVGDVFVGRLDPRDRHFVQVRRRGFDFLHRGGGAILSSISQCAQRGDDRALLSCLRDLTRAFCSLLESPSVTPKDLQALGLSSGCAAFVEAYIAHHRIRIDTDGFAPECC